MNITWRNEEKEFFSFSQKKKNELALIKITVLRWKEYKRNISLSLDRDYFHLSRHVWYIYIYVCIYTEMIILVTAHSSPHNSAPATLCFGPGGAITRYEAREKKKKEKLSDRKFALYSHTRENSLVNDKADGFSWSLYDLLSLGPSLQSEIFWHLRSSALAEFFIHCVSFFSLFFVLHFSF